MVVCPRCGEENPERFPRCGFCGASLTAQARERRKLVTLLFCDMTGSTSMGEQLDPESVRELMFRYYREMREAVDRHGGTVEKFVGDAVLAVFGVPIAHEDDALRALRAAADMQGRVEALNEDLERRFGSRIAVRIGVNTGEVVAGDPTQGQTILVGDAVNLAARLEQAAGPGEVLLSEQTYRLTRDSVTVEPVESLTLKGKADPVPAFRLLEVTSPEQTRGRRLDAEMVGRDAELALLRQGFADSAASRRCRVAFVLGEAGVGKSRLVAEFLEAASSKATVLIGRALSYGEGVTYWPLRDVVAEAAGIREDTDRERALAQVATLVEDLPEGEAIAAHLTTAIGLAERQASPQDIGWATRKLLEALARERPLVVVFDDLHWAEPAFLDLVEAVGAGVRDAPVFVLCVGRQDLLERHRAWTTDGPDRIVVPLAPLGEAESERLIGNMLGHVGLSDAVRARVIAAAAGNPLFIEELIAMLIDDGLLRRENESWVPAADLSSISIPPTIDALLGSRLDRLAAEEREAIERASIEGDVFHQGAVEALSPEEGREAVSVALNGLGEKELVHPTETTYVDDVAFRFHHMLVRDAAYRSTTKKARAQLHERFALWLEERAGARASEYDEIIGLHLERAHRYRADLGPLDEHGRAIARNAAERLGAAGRRALRMRADVRGAVNLLERAGALLPRDDPARIQLLPDLGSALLFASEFQRADEVLGEAIELAGAAGDRRTEWEASIERASLRVQAGLASPDEALDVAVRAVPVLEELGDDRTLAKAWRLTGFVQGFMLCRWEACREAAMHGLRHARQAGDMKQQGDNLIGLLFSLMLGPTPVEAAIEECERIRQATAAVPQARAGVLSVLGPLEARRGRFDEARRLMAESRAIHEELGYRLYETGSSLQYALIELLAGDPVAAERELRRVYEALTRIGGKHFLAAVALLLARALYLQGRYDEAEEFVRAGEEALFPNDVWTQITFRGTHAKLLAQRGALEDAERSARAGVELSRETDALEIQAEALLDLAEVLFRAGRPGEAVPLVQEASSLFERKGNVVAVGRIEAAMREQSGHPAPAS